MMEDKKKKSLIIKISVAILVILAIILILLMVCTKHEYKIIFDSNGGSNVSSITVKEKSIIKRPTDPKREGYAFVGWYYNNKLYDFNTKVTKNMTLKAKWSNLSNELVLNYTNLTLPINNTEILKVTKIQDGYDLKDLIWESSDNSIATIDNDGNIKALKKGTVIITVKTKDGKYKTSCTVTVTEEKIEITDLNINGTNTVAVGSTIKLTAVIKPDNATNKKITWKSSNNSIATVDENGNVKGLKEGTVTITATTDNGKSATFKITVRAKSSNSSPAPSTPSTPSTPQYYPVTAISVSGPNEVVEGQAIKLNVSISPANATNKGVVWRVNNGNATIDQSGNLTGVHAGSVVVTVTSTDSNQSATWNVTVKEKPGSYSITLTAISTTIGEKQYSISVTRNGQAFNDYNWIQFGSYGAPFPAGQYVSAGIVENNIKGVSTATITITNTKYINIDGANIKATVNIR